ncbi:hypothetical protein CC2G_004044 [Coprinopsis cinerea AmutBmut pab1-1]|nr:hypothetical protein CC2G_004044 [Coprinopsis cinerea AmutBmut pab1-1]
MTVIVVVGGGAAGCQVVRGLAAQLHPTKHKLILITPRPQYINLLGSLRVMVDPNASLNTVFLPFEKLFGHFPGELKVASVKSVEVARGPYSPPAKDAHFADLQNTPPVHAGAGGTLLLSTGEIVRYDILVLATGSVYEGLVNFPLDPKEYHDHIEKWRKKISDAQNIVIAGGGPVGIELAGELMDVYPSKKVTIVQGDRLVLNDVYPDRFRKGLLNRLRKRGVEVILNDAIRGNPPVDASVKTREGRELACDLLITCRGGGANTPYLKFLRPSPLSERGYVKVHPTFEVLYHPGIFALGDIVDWPEVKQMTKINYGHNSIVIENVLSMVRGETMTRMYKGTTDIMAISIGRNGGASYLGLLWGIVLGDFLTKTLKSKTLLQEKVRDILGLS